MGRLCRGGQWRAKRGFGVLPALPRRGATPPPSHRRAQWVAADEAAFLAGGGTYASTPGTAAAPAASPLASPAPAPAPNVLYLPIPTACPCVEAGTGCHWGTCACCQDCCENRPLGDPGASFVDLEADVYRSMVHVLLEQQVGGGVGGGGRACACAWGACCL